MTITDDDLFEGTETFNYSITRSSVDGPAFVPDVTTVNIIDNEGWL